MIGLTGFFKERFRRETSTRSRAEALLALGKTGDAAVAPFLKASPCTWRRGAAAD
jgi:hypothetical protein